jgi:hypothetical protein
MIDIPAERLAVLDRITLGSGSHQSLEHGACAMEVVAYLAREGHTDHPQCTCPTIAGFMRSWNDSISDADERTRVLRPLLTTVIGTRGGDRLMMRRVYMALDWDIRVRVPAWLRAAGLDVHADALASLPEIATRQALVHAHAASDAAWAAAWVASDAASAAASAASDAVMAAWNAASDAASAAARATASDAASGAARAAVRATASAAAWAVTRGAVARAAWNAASDAASAAARATASAAAWAAVRASLRPTVETLQTSAADLVRRMCALTESDLGDWHWDEVAPSGGNEPEGGT